MSFGLFSAHAERVELCLFARADSAFSHRRIDLQTQGDGIWRTYLEAATPGLLYGYRVDGLFQPQEGHRFNPGKLLVDPWALAVTGEPGSLEADGPHTVDLTDSAAAMPKAVVVDPRFDWQGVERPGHSWQETVIYEAHVKGLTQHHPQVTPAHRGTYLGLAEVPVLEHLSGLGVTALELMPVFQIASEVHLARRGRRNYWGYSPLSYFAPHGGYATGAHGQQVQEFKTMVRECHRRGIEVFLDVVFNHSPEGGADGPTWSLRGLDNRSYYRLNPRDLRRYVDSTGCGNTLDFTHPAVIEMTVASLEYWVVAMGVDGFRFDLATTLARGKEEFEPHAPLLEAVAKAPALQNVKWIAEPWDLGPGGYRLGEFPESWAEWNDRFRIAARSFWRGDGDGAELSQRLTGSRDIFVRPQRSINYVTSHDGFTLADLVSYENKHNEANGEDNRDGSDYNLSRNWGTEGPTDDPIILEQRHKACRNLLTTLLLAPGVPMISHGDELGRSQGGNNNPYCQDNELTWLDWSQPESELTLWMSRLLKIRRRYSDCLQGEARILTPRLHDAGSPWTSSPKTGSAKTETPGTAVGSSFAVWFSSDAAVFSGAGEALLLCVNGGDQDVAFTLPRNAGWHCLVDTAKPTEPSRPAKAREHLRPFSTRLFLRHSGQQFTGQSEERADAVGIE